MKGETFQVLLSCVYTHRFCVHVIVLIILIVSSRGNSNVIESKREHKGYIFIGSHSAAPKGALRN